MGKYKYDEKELKLIEECCIPMAVYQFIDKRVVTIALSKGLLDLTNCASFEEAYDLMDHNMYRDTHPDDIARIADEAVRFATEGGVYDIRYRSKSPEGYLIIHSIGKHIIKGDGTRLAVIQYINEGLYHENDSDNSPLFSIVIDKKLNYDHLTGLPHMNYFFELAEAFHVNALAEGKDHAMLFLDFCGLKTFNQKFGYAEGDRIIKGAGDLLAKHFSRDNCCRTTADHFTVYTYLDDLEEHLSQFMEEVKSVSDKKVPPVRIGIYNTELDKYSDFPSATAATDRAKIACDSCGEIFESEIRYFDEKMLKQYEDKIYVLDNIDKALENEWIKVYYQPMVRTSNGSVCTEEALARWMDPEKGMIPPLSFIPVLEDAKISYKLDLYIVEQVCRKLKVQAENNLFVVPNTINLSRTDFYACDMVEEITKRVDAAGLCHKKIIIEITESVVTDDIEYMKIQIDRFHEAGFEVWMDDFGAGYSSPSILQEIHFDTIKIDKLFVDNITTNESSRIIINEFVRLFNGLGCETVAEGVETAEQVAFLTEIGCTKLQGYYYCKPISLKDILERYEQGKQIGFENPKESDYYATIGNVNLYDISTVAEEHTGLQNYFNTIPMFIVEANDEGMRFIRGNKGIRDFIHRYYPDLFHTGFLPYFHEYDLGHEFSDAVKQCRETGIQLVVDVRTDKDAIIHTLITKIATNPEKNVSAISVAILGYVDNDLELKQKEEMERIQQERKAYERVMALSGDYIVIYSVDPKTDHFVEFSASDSFRRFGIPHEGEDFFGQSVLRSSKILFIEDQNLYLSMFTRENVLKDIEEKGLFTLNYRLMLDGVPKYVSLKAALIEEDNGPKIIVGLVDTDAQVKKDIEYNRKLMAARDIANIDTLTRVKNKHAYVDVEDQLDHLIEQKNPPEFALVVFDINDLKVVNDTKGHQAGDEYIKKGVHRICKTFQHSPVFRIGGDEFVAIAQGDDYKNIEKLMEDFHAGNEKNKDTEDAVIAVGMKKYEGEKSVAALFEKADKEMYENKRKLKE